MALLLRVSLHFYLFVCLFFIWCSVRFTFPPFARQKRVLQKRVLSTQKHECNLVTCWTKLKTKQKVDGLFFTDLNNDRWNSHSHSMFKSGIYTVVNRKHFKKLGFCNHKAWAALASLQYQLQYLALAPVSLFFSPRLCLFSVLLISCFLPLCSKILNQKEQLPQFSSVSMGAVQPCPPPHVPALYTLPLKFVRPKVCEETATLLVSGGHRAPCDKLQELIWHHLGVVTSLLCWEKRKTKINLPKHYISRV